MEPCCKARLLNRNCGLACATPRGFHMLQRAPISTASTAVSTSLTSARSAQHHRFSVETCMIVLCHGSDAMTAACCSDVFLVVSVPTNFSTLIVLGTPVPQQSYNNARAHFATRRRVASHHCSMPLFRACGGEVDKALGSDVTSTRARRQSILMAHIYSSNSFDGKNLNSKRRTDVCDRGDTKTSAENF